MRYSKFLLTIALVSLGFGKANAQACSVQDCSKFSSAYLPYFPGVSETWTAIGHCYIYQEVVVTSGSHLTINQGIFHFLQDGKITVEPGGRLTVTGSFTELTACNANSTWKGIEVQGSINLPAGLPNQGYVFINNGATISQAEVAVSHPNSALNGGVVIADDATFRNNLHSIDFMEYNGGDNPSSFTESDFIIDEDFANIAVTSATTGDYVITNQVKITKCDGISVYGCRFENNFSASGVNDAVHFDLLESAIEVLDASLEIDRSPNGPTNPDCPQPLGVDNYFRGWNDAVVLETTNGNTESLRIVGSLFEDNINGVFIKQNVQAVIYDNVFKNEQSENDIIDRGHSSLSTVLRKATGIKCVDLRERARIFDNEFVLNRQTLNEARDLYAIFYRGWQDWNNKPYPRQRVGYNDFYMSGNNPSSSSADYEIVSIKIQGYEFFDLEAFCNHFSHNGNSYNALGGSSNVQFADIYKEWPIIGVLDIGGKGFTSCSTGLCGEPGKNQWTAISTPCVNNVSNIVADLGTGHYLSDGTAADTPTCINSVGGSVFNVTTSTGTECDAPDWCDLFDSSEGGNGDLPDGPGSGVKGKRTDGSAEKEEESFSFYPNPANEVLQFSTAIDVTLYTMSGQVVLQAKAVDHINTADLKNGIYLMETSNGLHERLMVKH